MKLTGNLLLALIFVGLLVLLGVGIWLYQSLTGPSDTATTRDSGLFGSLFPFGRGGGTSDGTGVGDDPDLGGGTVPMLRKISNEMVAGAGLVSTTGGLVIRYVERQTGHIYQTPVDSLAVTRLTNTTVPAVYNALWTSSTTAIMQFAGDDGSIENFVGTVASTSVDQELRGSFLKPYDRVSIDTLGNVLGLTKNSNGSTLELVPPGGAKPTLLLSSTIASWVPIAAGGKYFVQSAPTGLARGALYQIVEGQPARVVGDILGLSANIRPDGKWALISGINQAGISLSVYDLQNKANSVLQLGTLAEKCGWVPTTVQAVCAIPKTLPQATWPDDWLLGRVHTSDELWLIDTNSGTVTALLDLEAEANVPIDATEIQVSESGDYAIFTNKIDQTLWSVTIQKGQ